MANPNHQQRNDNRWNSPPSQSSSNRNLGGSQQTQRQPEAQWENPPQPPSSPNASQWNAPPQNRENHQQQQASWNDNRSQNANWNAQQQQNTNYNVFEGKQQRKPVTRSIQ